MALQSGRIVIGSMFFRPDLPNTTLRGLRLTWGIPNGAKL
jgi:hypothetical protein